MPNEISGNNNGVTSTSENREKESPLLNDSVMAHFMQIAGTQSYQPTQAQVDKMLEMQEKGMDYTFKERNTFTAERITRLVVFFAVLLTFIGVFVFATYKVPQYLGEIISGMVGFLTGGVGGYGYAQTRKSKSTEDDG